MFWKCRVKRQQKKKLFRGYVRGFIRNFMLGVGTYSLMLIIIYSQTIWTLMNVLIDYL